MSCRSILPAKATKRPLDFEQSVDSGRFLLLEKRDCDVMYGNARRRFSIERATVSMTVEDEICTMAVNDLRQSGGTKEWKYLRRFPHHRRGDW